MLGRERERFIVWVDFFAGGYTVQTEVNVSVVSPLGT